MRARVPASLPLPPAEESVSWLVRLFRTPLLTKLVVLDLVINAIALVVMRQTPPAYQEQVTLWSLVVVLILNALLVAYALRPLSELEDTARRVSHGEYAARTVMPPLADRNLVRIGDTLNSLLNRVESDRERLRALTAQVIEVSDQERAHIARELHDGTAQSLSALDMLMSSTLRDHADEPVSERLGIMREIIAEALVEVRALSHSVHPRVLDDLGLAAALEALARRIREQYHLEVEVEVAKGLELGRAPSSVLYRVAQEATHNALKHADPHHIRIALHADEDAAVLEVVDDGRGFDRDAIGDGGMGLFVMQERMGLIGGVVAIDSAPGQGTQVVARVPMVGRTA